MFTDTHCHILREYYEDIDCVLASSIKKGVNRFINAAYDEKSILEVIELAGKYPNVYGAIGIHPSEASFDKSIDLNIIPNNLKKKNIIAIGEIGLDYHYGKDNMAEQKLLFHQQLEMAVQYHIPVVIHSREATEDTINILKQYSVRGVMHSFSGSYETAKKYIDMGFLLGINGTVTFKNSHLIEVVKKIGLEHIILETDCPYLTPEPLRGQTNNPANISLIAEYIAKNMNISLPEIAKIIDKNMARIFDI